MKNNNTNIYIFLVALILALALTVAGQAFWAAVSFSLFSIVFLIYLIYSFKQIRTQKYMETMATHLNSQAQEGSLHFPLPMILVSEEKKIVWYNKNVLEIAPSIEVLQADLSEYIKEIDIRDENTQILFNAYLAEKHFLVAGKINYSKSNDEYSLTLYLIDKSEAYDAEMLRKAERACVCMIMIDNYDDIVKNLEETEEDAGVIINEINEFIDNWVDDNEAISLKYEKDKYFVIMQNKYVTKQIRDKFNFLEEIKLINKDSKFPITLSLGIGDSEESLIVASKNARDSLDMALGRGGDQVVIKHKDDYIFFGGRSKEHEKRTKVKPRLIADALTKIIPFADKIYIMGHNHADPDSIGAIAGFMAICRSYGKMPTAVINKSEATSPQILEILEGLPEYKNSIEAPNDDMLKDENALVILVDSHKSTNAEFPELLLKEGNKVILVDHHRREAGFIENTVLAYHEPYASSASEMVVEILQYMSGDVDLLLEEAKTLYAGVMIDTKNFNFKSGSRTFEVAGYLRSKGVDTIEIKRMFQVSKDVYTLRAKVIKNAEIYIGQYAIAIVPLDKPDKVFMSQCADELLSLQGIEASFILCKNGDNTNISARSLNSVNVQLIMEKMGGGGHLSAAGADVEGKPKDVVEQLKKIILEEG